MPVAFCHRWMATSTKTGSSSMAKQRRPSRSAAMICEPDPEKGSKQMAPRLVCLRTDQAKTLKGSCWLRSPPQKMRMVRA